MNTACFKTIPLLGQREMNTACFKTIPLLGQREMDTACFKQFHYGVNEK